MIEIYTNFTQNNKIFDAGAIFCCYHNNNKKNSAIKTHFCRVFIVGNKRNQIICQVSNITPTTCCESVFPNGAAIEKILILQKQLNRTGH